MKKILLLAAAAMLAVAANAQLMTSRTFFGKESNTTWFMRAGMSVNNVANGGDGLESAIGFDVDFGFQKPIASTAAYWGMELGIGTRGCGVEHIDETINTYGVKWSPLTFGYKWAVTDNIKIDPHFGAFLEYDFAKSDLADNMDVNDFDAGIQIGAGVWFKRFNLDFTYQRGFCAVVDVPDGVDAPTSSNFMIRVGFAF